LGKLAIELIQNIDRPLWFAYRLQIQAGCKPC